MKKYKSIRSLISLVVVLALMLSISGAAYSEVLQTQTPDGSVTINSGALGVTAPTITLTALTLTGSDSSTTSVYSSNAWTALDGTGSGAGWNLTIISTDFISSAGENYKIDIDTGGGEHDAKFEIQLLDTNIDLVEGNTKPTSNVNNDLMEIPFTDEITPLNFLSAAVDEGMGNYTLAPNFKLMVPAETYVGIYTATVTVTIVSGPGS